MYSPREPDTICLGVAIDHRIRALFQRLPRTHGYSALGSHISIIQELGYKLDRCAAEVGVTGVLAGPATAGGIAVILQQPRDEHPYGQGATAVIDDCDTLWAVKQIFDTVSCGTIDLQRDISTFDLLPYTTPDEVEERGEDLDFLGDRFNVCVEAVCHKKPDVVLCAGRYFLPEAWGNARRNQCKGEAWKLEGKGIGGSFGKFSTIRLKGTRVCRVNAFHPSYALHYHPQYSCFIQLLLLAVCQACSVYMGDWTESVWMEDLRATCTEFSGYLGQYPDQENEDEEPIYLYYCSQLRDIRDTITSIASSHAEPYQGLVDSLLSNLFNDASLALRLMLEEQSVFEILPLVVSSTFDLVGQDFNPRGWFGSDRIKDTIIGCFKKLKECVTFSIHASRLDLNMAMNIFLEAAEALEIIMWDFRPPQVLHPGQNLDVERLTDGIGRLSL